MPEVQYVNTTNTTQLPAWMQSSIQDILARGTGLANEPYQPYGGPRVAGFTADQTAGQDFLRDNVTAYAPWLGAAGNYTNMAGGMNVANAGNLDFNAAAKMFSDTAGVDTAGIATPLVGEGSQYLRQSTQGSGYDTGSPYIQQSTAPMGYNAAQPYIQASTMPTGLAAAQPYMNMAGTSFPQAADAYMQPWMTGVNDRIAELGARNLNEYLLPGISDQFVRAGQFGSAQQRDVVGRALRDTQESVLGQQAQSLERGYAQAGQNYASDAARYAGLAGTAGGLGQAQQQAQLSAGTALGGLGQGQQQLMQNAGTALGGLTNTDLQRLQSAGINLGQFGISQANLAAQDQSRALSAAQGIAGLGIARTNAANMDALKNLQAGSQMGSLSNLQNNFVLQNAGALGASGDQQQAQNQANLNVAYGDFQNQQQYPWQQLGNLSSIVHGLPMSTTQTGQTTQTSPSPSVASQVGGIALGGLGLANSGIFRAKGGAVRKYARGGRVRCGGGLGDTYRMAA